MTVPTEDELPGTPSDDAAAILAVGGSGVTTLFVSMATRHPGGADAAYLAWHGLDHRPEQQRIAGVRTSFRIVSTPQCRAARAAQAAPYDAVDHLVTYFFGSRSDLDAFTELSTALRDAGRTPYVLPPVDRGVYDLSETIAAPRIKAGADVLPWWPSTGIYVLLETGPAVSARPLLDVGGVAGAWSATGDDGRRLTYCFLDDGPVATAQRLQPVLAQRWRAPDLTPLLAAPFHVVVPREWDRYLP